MAAPSATCELWLDGVRVPDTGVDLYAGAPTALSGLALAWGRDGPNEQPGPATCVVDILDQSPAADFLDQLHVGSSVAVWAVGEIPGEAVAWGPSTYTPTQSTWAGVPDGLPPARSVGGINITTNPPAGTSAGRIVAETLAVVTTTGFLVVTVPPRPFSPTGEEPTAWDDLPKASVGETWRVQAAVKAPAGVRYRVRVSGYRAPYGTGSWSMSTTAGPPEATGTGAWQLFDWTPTITALSEPLWLAVAVTLVDPTGTGVRWQDQTGTWAADTRTWDAPGLDPRVYLDNVFVFPPGAGTSRRVLVFSGAVSDVKAVPEPAGLLYTVTAADLGADLGNRVIGDDPWPVQTVATRANRVAQLAGITTNPRIRIDTPLDAIQVSARDVDAQPSYALLQDLATTAGGVLWAATHAVTGPFLWLENPDNRAAVVQLELSGGLITITGQGDDVTTISACDVLLDGVQWLQDTQDVATVVAVTWLEQGVDDDGAPTTTERTVTVTAPAGDVTRYGTRRLSISTELVNAGDATTLANRALVQARAVGWRVEGLTLDTGTMPDQLGSLDDTTRQISLLNLLDGTTRMGLALTLVDMPAYAPRGTVSSYYLEGGAYRFAGGAWALELAASPSAGQGSSATWAELDPAWTWAQWSPDIQWQDLYGVAA